MAKSMKERERGRGEMEMRSHEKKRKQREKMGKRGTKETGKLHGPSRIFTSHSRNGSR